MSNKKSLNRFIQVYHFKSKYPVNRHGHFFCLQLSLFTLSYQRLARSVVAIKDDTKPGAVTYDYCISQEDTSLNMLSLKPQRMEREL